MYIDEAITEEEQAIYDRIIELYGYEGLDLAASQSIQPCDD